MCRSQLYVANIDIYNYVRAEISFTVADAENEKQRLLVVEMQHLIGSLHMFYRGTGQTA